MSSAGRGREQGVSEIGRETKRVSNKQQCCILLFSRASIRFG